MSTIAEERSIEHATAQHARELWTSFASLLRSHVAMRSIALPKSAPVVASASEMQLQIVGPNDSLRVSAVNFPDYGTIEWTGEDDQNFFFTEDGLIAFTESGMHPAAMDIESAVEHLLDRVCR